MAAVSSCSAEFVVPRLTRSVVQLKYDDGDCLLRHTYSKSDMVMLFKIMPASSPWCKDLSQVLFTARGDSPHWKILKTIGAAETLASRANLTLPSPWKGPLTVAQRAIALHLRTPRTWDSPCTPLKPIQFRPRATYSFEDSVAGPLAGIFSLMCTLNTQAKGSSCGRDIENEMASGMESMKLEQPMHHALQFFPLEVWDVIAAHLVTPVATQGLRAVPQAARSLACLSCTSPALHEAAAAGWACLGSYVAVLMDVAASKSRQLLREMQVYCYTMPRAWMQEYHYYGARKSLSDKWTQDKLAQRRVDLRVKGHLCMRCMQYATHGCVRHACLECCRRYSCPGECYAHGRFQVYKYM